MDLERIGLQTVIGLILRNGRLRLRGFRILKASVWEFFLPQFESRRVPGIRPVAVVYHPLDDALPFKPHLFSRYLGYFSMCMKTVSCLYRMYGKQALGDIEGMMRDVVLLYDTAGKVYRYCQSTTTSRPAAPVNPWFLLIVLFDPHLHCIPSLHVLTICYNYHQTRKIVTKLDPAGASGNDLVAQTYRLALRITETILLVKQHSLLDIGPSLFLLSRLFPDYDEEEIRRFVSGLFAGVPGVDPATAAQVRRAILGSYEELLKLQLERGNCAPTEILLDYVRAMVP